MKTNLFYFAAILMLGASTVLGQVKSPAAPPATGTTSPSEPCGNPEPSATPYCWKCVDGSYYYLPQVGSSCESNSIRS